VKALVMAGSALRRLARDRLALFFIVLLPVVIILIIGLTFGDAASERLPVGVVDQGAGRLGSELRAGLEASPALDARAYDDADALGKAVRRGVVAAGVVVPAGHDQALRAGRPAEVTFVVDQTRPAPAPVRSAVAAVVARQAAEVKAARFAAEEAGVPFDAALARARALAAGQQRLAVEATTIGHHHPVRRVPGPLRHRDAPGADHLRRRLARVRGRLGRPPGRPPPGGDLRPGRHRCRHAARGRAAQRRAGHLDRPAGRHRPWHARRLHVAPGHRPRPMRTFGHLFPQAWAMDAFIALIARNAGLAGILRQLAVLAAFAAALLALAAWRLRRTLVG
jgi:hypothetical protein